MNENTFPSDRGLALKIKDWLSFPKNKVSNVKQGGLPPAEELNQALKNKLTAKIHAEPENEDSLPSLSSLKITPSEAPATRGSTLGRPIALPLVRSKSRDDIAERARRTDDEAKPIVGRIQRRSTVHARPAIPRTPEADEDRDRFLQAFG
jgi:hypothetical protein